MQNTAKDADFIETLEDFDAGVFTSVLTKALADVGLSVVEHGAKGSLVITLDVSRIGESAQLQVKHRINSTKPTLRGDLKEKYATSSVMHINKNGSMTVMPDAQLDLFKDSPKQETIHG